MQRLDLTFCRKANVLKTIKTVCHRDCPDTCFMDVSVEQGKLIATRGSTLSPVTRGFLCPRGNGDPQRVYSQKRVLYPHLKSGAGGSRPLSRVTWDVALTLVSDRIQATIDTHGKQSLLLYDYAGNTGFLAWHFAKRLWSDLEATTTDYSLCSSSGHSGIGLHYGMSYGLQLAEMAASKVILFWGNNAKVSAPHIWAMARQAKKDRAAILVSIDPRQSSTAEAADIWIQPRPGSDVALGYGIARYLIENNGVDPAFIGQWTTGFPAYARAAMEWAPERVERVSGVPGRIVDQIGDVLMAHRPAAFMIGLGLQKSMQGAEAARAVALLPALLGLHRGFQYSNSRGHMIDWPAINGGRRSGHRRKVVSQVGIGQRLAAGEFKLVYIFGSNPAITLPDQVAVRRGLDREDVFVVVHDTHWSETATRADVVLPAPTFLEKRDVAVSDHHAYTRLSEQAIVPLGDSWHEVRVMQQLAKRLGLTADWLYEDPWAALEKALAHTYREGGLHNLLSGEVLELKSRPNQVYQTPSGKIEFAVTVSHDASTPLPTQHPLPREKTWLVLLNSSTPKYTHSQFTDVYGPIPKVVWVHPKDAGQRAIEKNDVVAVFNELATVTVHATVTDRVLPGTLWVPRPLIGINGVPLNALVPGISQGIGGGPIFNSVKVKIKRVAGCSE
jgi:anaerobic selenocysteine-containing dehydrogenase